jgi:hypothetical protein
MDLNRYLPGFEFEEVMDQDEEEEKAVDQEVVKNEEHGPFQLFSNTGLTRVRLKSPEPEQVYAKRPDTYYFSKPSDAEKRQIESVALAGQDVLKLSTEVWPGMKMPWKVVDFDKLKATADLERKRARQRPGKKAREQFKKRSGIQKTTKKPEPVVYGPSRTYSNPKLPADKSSQQRGRKNTRGRGRGRGGARFRGGGYPRKPGSG